MRACCYLCVLVACNGSDPPKLPDWEKTLPPASEIGAGSARGWINARGIVHLHSPFSHDACDGKPRDAVTNAVNEPCLQSLRAALCTDRIDYAALTDHDDTMADEEYAALFHMRPGDQAVMVGSDQVASRISCDNGHQVLITVGGENDLMPVMLDRHVPGTVDERHDTYNGRAAADATVMRDAGAKIWIPHTESRTLDQLRLVQPDGIEVYNLHANIDPDIREMYLGLDSAGAIAAAVEFADTNEGGPEPDLALLAFLAPNMPAINTWNALLGEGFKIAVTAGSDAHENALPIKLADGERGDSYRRVMRWFSNVVLVTDPKDPVQIEAALARGRMFAVFELMGTPDGFDVIAVGSGMAELGDTAPFASTHLMIKVPRVKGLDPTLPAPEIKATVIRVTSAGASVVMTGSGPDLDVALPGPGAYRVEVSIIPRHLGPYLKDLGTAMADRELPWIYTSPIYLE